MIAVTGIGIEVPGLTNAEDLLALRVLAQPATFDPVPKLGRKGLLYKDRATKLALCAVQDALARAALPVRDLYASACTGVVVSSNLGNVDTVCRIIDTLYGGSTADLSPMDVPNASSNVIASSIAIRFGCRALNLMLCNGATSGTDALFVASNALRARRAERMIVVGVEPNNEYVEALVAASVNGNGHTASKLRLGEGAACVILETVTGARRRGATVYGVIGRYRYVPFPNGATLSRDRNDEFADHSLWFTPNQAWSGVRDYSNDNDGHEASRTSVARCDLSETLGELYGALGVFQCVAACLWLEQQSGAHPSDDRAVSVLATSGGSWGDGLASVVVRAHEA